MTEQVSENTEAPNITISYALAQDSEPSYQKNLESAMQVLLHHALNGSLAIVDCVDASEEGAETIPVVAAIIEHEGQQAILPLGTMFTEKDRPSERFTPVLTDPRKVN